MISIKRPKDIPSKLAKEGAKETSNNKKLFSRDPSAYINGKKFDIKNSIYGHPTVKSVLKTAQHNKCCFCEKDQVEEYGAVEHFRPKNGFKSSRKQKKLSKPGYYWLAYDWDNLFFVCSFCNGAEFKGNLFPLQDENKRAISHRNDYKKEKPYLINPAKINPRKHIYFDNQLVCYHSDEGRETISICGLDRETLNDERKKVIENIEVRLLILAAKDLFDPADVEKARDFIRKARDPKSPYSATAIDYLSKIPSQ